MTHNRCADAIVVSRQTERVDRYNTDRLQPRPLDSGNPCFEAHRIHVEGVFTHVDKDRDRIEPSHHLGGGGESERGYQHRLPEFEVLGH
jgi:hypothetical protein